MKNFKNIFFFFFFLLLSGSKGHLFAAETTPATPSSRILGETKFKLSEYLHQQFPFVRQMLGGIKTALWGKKECTSEYQRILHELQKNPFFSFFFDTSLNAHGVQYRDRIYYALLYKPSGVAPILREAANHFSYKNPDPSTLASIQDVITVVEKILSSENSNEKTLVKNFFADCITFLKKETPQEKVKFTPPKFESKSFKTLCKKISTLVPVKPNIPYFYDLFCSYLPPESKASIFLNEQKNKDAIISILSDIPLEKLFNNYQADSYEYLVEYFLTAFTYEKRHALATFFEKIDLEILLHSKDPEKGKVAFENLIAALEETSLSVNFIVYSLQARMLTTAFEFLALNADRIVPLFSAHYNPKYEETIIQATKLALRQTSELMSKVHKEVQRPKATDVKKKATTSAPKTKDIFEAFDDAYIRRIIQSLKDIWVPILAMKGMVKPELAKFIVHIEDYLNPLIETHRAIRDLHAQHATASSYEQKTFTEELRSFMEPQYNGIPSIFDLYYKIKAGELRPDDYREFIEQTEEHSLEMDLIIASKQQANLELTEKEKHYLQWCTQKRCNQESIYPDYIQILQQFCVDNITLKGFEQQKKQVLLYELQQILLSLEESSENWNRFLNLEQPYLEEYYDNIFLLRSLANNTIHISYEANAFCLQVKDLTKKEFDFDTLDHTYTLLDADEVDNAELKKAINDYKEKIKKEKTLLLDTTEKDKKHAAEIEAEIKELRSEIDALKTSISEEATKLLQECKEAHDRAIQKLLITILTDINTDLEGFDAETAEKQRERLSSILTIIDSLQDSDKKEIEWINELEQWNTYAKNGYLSPMIRTRIVALDQCFRPFYTFYRETKKWTLEDYKEECLNPSEDIPQEEKRFYLPSKSAFTLFERYAHMQEIITADNAEVIIDGLLKKRDRDEIKQKKLHRSAFDLMQLLLRQKPIFRSFFIESHGYPLITKIVMYLKACVPIMHALFPPDQHLNFEDCINQDLTLVAKKVEEDELTQDQKIIWKTNESYLNELLKLVAELKVVDPTANIKQVLQIIQEDKASLEELECYDQKIQFINFLNSKRPGLFSFSSRELTQAERKKLQTFVAYFESKGITKIEDYDCQVFFQAIKENNNDIFFDLLPYIPQECETPATTQRKQAEKEIKNISHNPDEIIRLVLKIQKFKEKVKEANDSYFIRTTQSSQNFETMKQSFGMSEKTTAQEIDENLIDTLLQYYYAKRFYTLCIQSQSLIYSIFFFPGYNAWNSYTKAEQREIEFLLKNIRPNIYFSNNADTFERLQQHLLDGKVFTSYEYSQLFPSIPTDPVHPLELLVQTKSDADEQKNMAIKRMELVDDCFKQILARNPSIVALNKKDILFQLYPNQKQREALVSLNFQQERITLEEELKALNLAALDITFAQELIEYLTNPRSKLFKNASPDDIEDKIIELFKAQVEQKTKEPKKLLLLKMIAEHLYNYRVKNKAEFSSFMPSILRNGLKPALKALDQVEISETYSKEGDFILKNVNNPLAQIALFLTLPEYAETYKEMIGPMAELLNDQKYVAPKKAQAATPLAEDQEPAPTGVETCIDELVNEETETRTKQLVAEAEQPTPQAKNDDTITLAQALENINHELAHELPKNNVLLAHLPISETVSVGITPYDLKKLAYDFVKGRAEGIVDGQMDTRKKEIIHEQFLKNRAHLLPLLKAISPSARKKLKEYIKNESFFGNAYRPHGRELAIKEEAPDMRKKVSYWTLFKEWFFKKEKPKRLPRKLSSVNRLRKYFEKNLTPIINNPLQMKTLITLTEKVLLNQAFGMMEESFVGNSSFYQKYEKRGSDYVEHNKVVITPTNASLEGVAGALIMPDSLFHRLLSKSSARKEVIQSQIKKVPATDRYTASLPSRLKNSLPESLLDVTGKVQGTIINIVESLLTFMPKEIDIALRDKEYLQKEYFLTTLMFEVANGIFEYMLYDKLSAKELSLYFQKNITTLESILQEYEDALKVNDSAGKAYAEKQLEKFIMNSKVAITSRNYITKNIKYFFIAGNLTSRLLFGSDLMNVFVNMLELLPNGRMCQHGFKISLLGAALYCWYQAGKPLKEMYSLQQT